jgi:hypothetical protein
LEPTRTAPRAAALQVEPTRTAPHAAALQEGQRCLRSGCALGAASCVDAASAPEQVLARRKVGAQYERRSAEEFEDGQVRQTGLTKKSPSPALKEAGQFGSYKSGAL